MTSSNRNLVATPLRVLVTGGAGYVGSVVVERLLSVGHTVTVVDDLSKGHRWAVPAAAEFESIDLVHQDAVGALLAAKPFDAVLHFAALSLVGESVAHPTLYMRRNLVATVNLLDAMRENGVRRFVFSSTAATYGEPDDVPIPETAVTRPTNPYGLSKLAIDETLRFEAAATDLGAVSLRYFNVAGASKTVGEVHEPETHLIPLVLQTAMGLRETISVFGTDYPTPDGTAIRDYVHVDDLAVAHVLALDSTTAPGHRVYNLGSGSGFSVREVINAARNVTGQPISVTEEDRRAGDPAVLIASRDLAMAELGWAPTKNTLEAMIGDAWAWMQENREHL